jgi:hypothetical protein
MPEWLGSVRSIVTILLTCTFCYMAIVGIIKDSDVMSVVMLVLGFYFVTKNREGQDVPQKPDGK